MEKASDSCAGRTMWEAIGLVVAAIIIWQVIAHFQGNPKFWRLIGRHPDLALSLFSIERGCLVDTTPLPEQKRDYVGPFRFRTNDGTTHKVYMLASDIDAIQARIAKPLSMTEGRIS